MGKLVEMPELTIVGLRVVDAVATAGSFTAAARSLGYTQSAVSRQVALMESACGGPLFERRPRGVTPTARGRALAGHGTAVLARLDAAALQMQSLDETLAGRVVLGAFPTALATLVPAALAHLRRAHPGLEVRLREGGTVAQLRRLRAGQIHVAVIARGRGLDHDVEGLDVDLLSRGAPRVAIASDHRLAGRGSVTLAELAAEPWIVGPSDGDGPQFGVWPTLGEQARVAHAVRDWPGRLGLVAAGLGVAMVPSLLLAGLPDGVATVRVEEPRPLLRELLAATAPDRAAGSQAVVEALTVAAAGLTEDLRPPPGPPARRR